MALVPRCSVNCGKPLKWVVAAHFFTGAADTWLDDFMDDQDLRFEKVIPPRRSKDWHFRRKTVTPVLEWLAHFRHALAALRRKPDGIIVCFPQLAMCAALLKLILRRKVRIIAYNFNLGALPPGPRQKLARLASRQIDRFVVHSPLEIPGYARYLDVPQDRISFVPLQSGRIDIPRQEDERAPYLLALGSANRDYATLIAAVDALQIRTIIVTRPEAIETLPKSPVVTFMSGLTQRQCNELMAGARISVTPVANQETASGQVTFLTAMQMGVPVIATSCPGTIGYVEHDSTGLLVAAGDVAQMKAAIQTLWQDKSRRHDLAERARAEWSNRFSDKAAANSLQQLVREIGG